MRDRSVFPLLPPSAARLARVLRLGAALPLAAVLSVAACSSGGSPSGGQPTGSKSGAASTAAPGLSISAPPGAQLTGPGTVEMGKYTEVFVGPLPPGSAEARVAADFRQAMVLWDASQEQRSLVSPVESYVTGPALTDLITTIKNFSRHNFVPAGTDRLFKTSVASVTSSLATVTSCDDGSKFTEVNPKTGAVNPSFVNVSLNDQYVYITWGLVRQNKHWTIQTVNVVAPPKSPAGQCLPGNA